MIRRFIRRVLTPPMVVLAALILMFEEWLWDRMTALMAAAGRLPVLRKMEAGIAGLRPYPAMAVFLAPTLILLPVNLFAVYLTASGHAAAGASILIAAKIVSTALLARLFTLCRPSLLTVNWFRRLYEWLGRAKAWLFSSAPWLAAVRWKRSARERWQRLTHRWRGGHLKRRWQALRVIIRRRLGRTE